MTVTENGRQDLLQEYGRYYGEQRFAVAFTAGTQGAEAKKVATRGWDKTLPLATGDYGASYVAGRGQEKNPVIVLRPSNLIVLECDTEDDLVRIEALDLPDTVTVRSSEPYKRHLWFRPDPALESLPYVAFRFESGKLTADSGRYFLAPPSIHPSGAIYTFLPGHGPHDIDIATLDASLYRRLATNAQVEDDQLREAIELDPNQKIPEGSRRAYLFRYACMLRRWGLNRDEILQQVLHYNDTRCTTPVERRLVEVQVDGAMKKRGGQEIAEPRLREGHIEAPDPEHDSWLPIDLTTLPEKPPVPPTLGGVGIVYPGKRHVFSGPQESAKTLAAYVIGIEIVRQGGTIILIDFEMGSYDARGRLHELGATPDEIRRVRYLEPEEPANPERVNRLVAMNPQLVIVDAAAGAYDLQGLDDNKRQDVERIASLYVRGFWRNGIATILIDHVVKNTETRGKYAIGSERKVGGADVHLGFETITPISRGSSGLYKIVTHKDRGGFLQRGRLADLHLNSDPATHSITWEFQAAEHVEPGQTWMPTKVMGKISRHLAIQHEPLSRIQIITAAGGNKDVARKAIEHLIRLGHATETAGPHGAKLVQHLTIYDPENPPESDDLTHLTRPDPVLTQNIVTHLTRPDSLPTGEAGGGSSQEDQDKTADLTPTQTSWLDDLEPHEKEDPPADLWDESTPNDDLPF